RTVGEVPPVFASEGNALRNALIDDVHADHGQPIHVRLASTEVAALYGIVEEAIDAVAVVLVVLCGVDASLCSNRMRPARAVLVAECFDVVSLLTERRGERTTSKARADDDHV